MADKYLAEGAWKALAVGKGIKDPALGKALGAYAKLGEDGEPTARLAALGDVVAAAEKLAKDKAVAKVAEAAEHLAGVAKSAAKERRVLELLKASADKKSGAVETKGVEHESSEQEDEEGGDLGERLLAGLQRVRMGQGKVSLPFLATVASPAWGLLVAKRITPKDKKELLEQTGSRKFVAGTCTLEDGKLTFIMDALQAGLAKQLQKSIKLATGKGLQIRARDVSGAADEALDDVEALDDSPAPSPDLANDLKGLTTRLTKIAADMAPLAEVRQPDVRALIDNVRRDASGAASLLKNRELPAAIIMIERAEERLREAVEAAGPIARPSGREALASGGKVAIGKAKLAWEDAKKSVHGQLGALQKAIVAEFPDAAASAKKLDRILARLNEGLGDKLDALYAADAPATRKTLRAETGKVAASYLAYIQADELIAHLGRNPFVAVTVAETLSKPLRDLQGQLAAAKD
jgi:hypothetical protein